MIVLEPWTLEELKLVLDKTIDESEVDCNSIPVLVMDADEAGGRKIKTDIDVRVESLEGKIAFVVRVRDGWALSIGKVSEDGGDSFDDLAYYILASLDEVKGWCGKLFDEMDQIDKRDAGISTVEWKDFKKEFDEMARHVDLMRGWLAEMKP